jgi:hypothetical protein
MVAMAPYAGDRHRKGIDNSDMLRYFKMRNFPTAELADPLRRFHFAGQQPGPCDNNFPQFRIVPAC